MRDKLCIGAGAGFIGVGIMTVLIYLLNLLPGISIEMIERLSTLFISGTDTQTAAHHFMGILAHLVCGSMLGTIIFILLNYVFSFQYPVLKGLAVGFGAWFVLCGLTSRFLNIQLDDKFIDAFLLMLVHLPYGLITVLLQHRWLPAEDKK